MFQIVKGDILDANTAFICHQVNCMNVMGAGVAKAIYTKWPKVKLEYHYLCDMVADPAKLLGEIQVVHLHGVDKSVINVFGQLNYGRCKEEVFTDYNALQKAFSTINLVCNGKSVAFPYGFGCGLAGGDWTKVEELMLKCLPDCDVKLYMKI